MYPKYCFLTIAYCYTINKHLTIILRARVGYEMIDSQRGGKRQVSYNHLISNKREWNNCFIKNNQEIMLDLVDFALQEQPEENLIIVLTREWYNGSYTMAAEPIKSLELHYTMIQFLIIISIHVYNYFTLLMTPVL